MTEHPSLINLAEIPSNPVAFLVLTVLINLYTVLSVTVEKTKEFSRTPFLESEDFTCSCTVVSY